MSSYQKVATFKIVNGDKQGGNVAAYFCAPDGRVLHCVAGPVDAATFLREAKWVVETAKTASRRARANGAKFKEMFRKAHAEKLQDGVRHRGRGGDVRPAGPAWTRRTR